MWPTTERIEPEGSSDRRGFTLLELLIAVAIMSIAIVPLYMALNAAMESWHRGSAYQEAYQNARGAVDAIARDLDSLVFFPGDPSTRFIASQQYTDSPDNFSKWLTFNITVEGEGSDLCRILYFTVPDDFTLRREIVYQDWQDDGYDKQRALFEVDIRDPGPPRKVFPLNDDATVTEKLDVPHWKDFDWDASMIPKYDAPLKYMDPRYHAPLKRDGDQVANNIIELRFSYYYTRDTRTQNAGSSIAEPDGEFDEVASGMSSAERILHFEPATLLDPGSSRFNTGWYSHWPYYPDPDDALGVNWPPSPDLIRQTATGEPVPIGLPLAIGIEVSASDDAETYMSWDTANDGPNPSAVATVSQTIWLTSKWMSP